MGIFGGSSRSKTKTTINTRQEDRRVGATDDAIVVGENSNFASDDDTSINVESVDSDAITAALSTAFDFSGASQDRATRLLEKSLDAATGDAGRQDYLRAGLIIAALAVGVLVWRAGA